MTPFSSLVPGTVSSMKPFGPIMKPVKVLDADAYDTIELVAEMTGGIGASLFWALDGKGSRNVDCPVCVHGCAAFAMGMEVVQENELGEILRKAGIGVETNDQAVNRIRARQGLSGQGFSEFRASFVDWAQELNVVRGTQPAPSLSATWPTPNKRMKRCQDGAKTSPEASI